MGFSGELLQCSQIPGRTEAHIASSSASISGLPNVDLLSLSAKYCPTNSAMWSANFWASRKPSGLLSSIAHLRAHLIKSNLSAPAAQVLFNFHCRVAHEVETFAFALAQFGN